MEEISCHHSQDMTSSMPADNASQDEVGAIFTQVFDRFQKFAIIKHKDFYPTQLILDKIIEIANKFEKYSSALNETSKVRLEKKIHTCFNYIVVPETEKRENEIVLVEFLKQIVNTILVLSKSKRLPDDLVQNVILSFVSVLREIGSHWMNVRDADLVMNPQPESADYSQDVNKLKLDRKESQTIERELPIIDDKSKNVKDLSSVQVGIESQTELTAMFTEVFVRFQEFVFLKYRDFYPSSCVLYKFIEITNKFEKYFLNLNSGENLKNVETEIKQCTDHLVVAITENNDDEIVLVDFIKHIVNTVLRLANSKTLPLALIQTVIHSFLSVVNQVGSHWIQVHNAPPRDLQTKSIAVRGKTRRAEKRISLNMIGKLTDLYVITNNKCLSSNQAFDSYISSFLDALRSYWKFTESPSKASWKITTAMFSELDTSHKQLPNTIENITFSNLVGEIQRFIIHSHGSEVPPQSVCQLVITLIKSLELFLEKGNNQNNASICFEKDRSSNDISKNIQENMIRTSVQDKVASLIDCNKMFSELLNVGQHVQNIALPENSQKKSRSRATKVKKLKKLTNLKIQMILSKLTGIQDLITGNSLALNQTLDSHIRSLLGALGSYSEFCENHSKESFTNARTKFLEFNITPKQLPKTDPNQLFLKLVEEIQSFIVNTHGFEVPPNCVHTKVIALIKTLENLLKMSNKIDSNAVAINSSNGSLNVDIAKSVPHKIDFNAECLLVVSKVLRFLKQDYKQDIHCKVTCGIMVTFIDALESYVLYCTNGSPGQWSLAESKLNRVNSYDPKKIIPRDFALLQHSQKVKTAILNSKGERPSNQVRGELKALITTLKSILHRADVQKEVVINSSNGSLNVDTTESPPHNIDFNAECLKCIKKIGNFLENTYKQILPCDIPRDIIEDSITALQSYVLYCADGSPNQGIDARSKLSKVLSYDSKKFKKSNLQLVQHLEKMATLILESQGKRPSNDVRDGFKTLNNALIKITPNERKQKEVPTNTSYMQVLQVQPIATKLKNTQPTTSSSSFVQPVAPSSKNLQSSPAKTNHLPRSAACMSYSQPIPTNISFIQQSTNTSWCKPSNAIKESFNDRYENTQRDIYLINLLGEVKLATENYTRTPCPFFQEEISNAIKQLKRWSYSWGENSKEKINADIQRKATFDSNNIVGHNEVSPKETPKLKFVCERYNLRSNKTSKTIGKDESKKLTEKPELKLIDSLHPYVERHHTAVTEPIQKVNYSEKLVLTDHVVNKTINRYAFDEISLTKQQIKFLRSAIESIPSEPNSAAVQYCRNILAELKSVAALDNSAVRDIDRLIKSLEYALTGNETPASNNVVSDVQETDDCFMNGNERYLQRCEREFDGAAYQTCVQNTIDDLLKFEENARTLIEIDIVEEVEKSGEIMHEYIDSCSSDDGEWSDVSDENLEHVNNFTITKEDNRLVVELDDALKLNQDCDTNTPFPVIVTLADDETIDLTNKRLIDYKAFMLLLDETEDQVKLEFPTLSAFLLFVKENQSLVERLKLVSKGSSSLARTVRYNTGGLDVKCIHFLQSEKCIREQVNNLMSVFEECKRSKVAENSLLRDLSLTVKNIYPNHKLHVFGSRATGQALPDSDYDIFCDVTGNEYIRGINHTHQATCVEKVAAALKKSAAQRGTVFTTVLSLTRTRVPIVKVFHKPTQMNCDISFKDGTSMENTHLLNMYLSLDSRVAWVLAAVKLWAHYNHIQGSSYFTSHGLTWLLLFYLMKVGVVPPVMQVQSSTVPKIINNWDVSFQTPKSWCSRNTDSSVQLLTNFFAWLAHTDFSSYCLCTFTGEQIAKDSMTNINWMKSYNKGLFKNWAQRILMKRPRSRWNLSSYDMIETNGKSGLCVQDPFEHSKNVTKAVKGAKFVNFLQLSKETCRLLE
uniref:Terminal uridylyltransferase 7 n=1 Tax=Cacopsylla melanoneura TaxID=428564 RepID=A0A8D8MEP4_9HEMI